MLDPTLLTAIADDVIAFCASHANMIDGDQLDAIFYKHGQMPHTPRAGSKTRDGHMVLRAELRREVRRELANRNLRLDLIAHQNKNQSCRHTLRDAVEGSIEQLRDEPTVVPRRAKRAWRAFSNALERSPRYDLPADLRMRLEDDMNATTTDVVRILKRQYDLVVDIATGMGRLGPPPTDLIPGD